VQEVHFYSTIANGSTWLALFASKIWLLIYEVTPLIHLATWTYAPSWLTLAPFFANDGG
jgi:hypothetical protein